MSFWVRPQFRVTVASFPGSHSESPRHCGSANGKTAYTRVLTMVAYHRQRAHHIAIQACNSPPPSPELVPRGQHQRFVNLFESAHQQRAPVRAIECSLP